jgi:hypothetical protein
MQSYLNGLIDYNVFQTDEEEEEEEGGGGGGDTLTQQKD